MAIRRIRQLGDPILRERSLPVSDNAETRQILVDLRDTLHEFQRAHGFGRGISAVQIGIPRRVIYIEFEGATYELVNPACTWSSEERFRMWDDCFSFPDLLVYLERFEAVRVESQDANGRSRAVEARGALSELLQHELDHLDGVLAVDRALDRDSFMTRAEFLRRRQAASS